MYIPPSFVLTFEMHKRDLSTGATQPSSKRATNLARRTGGPSSNPYQGPTEVPMKSWNEVKQEAEDAARRIAATEQRHDFALVAAYWKAVPPLPSHPPWFPC